MITLNINKKDYRIDAAPDTPLLWVLRDQLGLTGVKYGCGIGECGSCTVLVDGKAERSCTTEIKDVRGKKIVTIEGLPATHPVKQAWIDKQVPQCGYCQPGMILQAVDVLTSNPNLSKAKMAKAMDDVMCRCGTHARVLEAMEVAAGKMKGGRS